MNLSLAIKNLYTVALLLYFLKNKAFNIGKSFRIRTFIPVNLLNNPLSSCSLTNFEFL